MRKRWLALVAALVITPAVLATTTATGSIPSSISGPRILLSPAGVLDSDGDGILDLFDNCPGVANPGQEDTDNDGTGDACEPPPPADGDGDGIPDATDNCPATPNPGQVDTDGDGLGNACDGTPTGDDDNDGIDNATDNCPAVANAGQVDTDGDGLGNACDGTPTGDDDNDGIDNATDNCPAVANAGQVDTDGDGLGNACDGTPTGDDDNDGADNATDNCPAVANAGQQDTDNDGLGDACDGLPNGDNDNDGVDNATDNCPAVANAGQQDMDGDGSGDACDGTPTGNAPVVNAPSSITVEANGPEGSVVTFPDPANASDDNDADIHGAPCNPGSGSTFKLGKTSVTCSVTDNDGNVGSGSFVVTVEDTTPPVVTPPVDLWIQTTDQSVSASNGQITTFIGGATAEDIVDESVAITNDAPTSFKKGVTTVTFIGKDDAGNSTNATATVTISPDPAPPSTQDRTPPGNVSGVEARTGDRSAILRWKNPSDEDFDRVVLSREPGAGGAASSVVYEGPKAGYKDTGLQVGTQYRYLLVTYDKSGNRSAGVAVVVVGRQQLLFTPADGAAIAKPPTLRWAKVGGATYYNVQLWKQPARSGSNSTVTPGKKVYSAWPATNKLKLKKSWKFAGKRYKLVPGVYRWYVWPGMGPRKKNTYGDLIGQSEFVVKAKKR